MTTRNVQGRKKTTKIERMAQRSQALDYHQKGEGLFRFRNRSKEATLTLPKPAADGTKMIGPANPKVPGSGEFEGDSYFLKLVPREIILVKTIIAPGSNLQQEINMTEQKLILDQPEKITQEGAVEHVSTRSLPLNEQPGSPAMSEREKLLTEDPMDGVTIIRD